MSARLQKVGDLIALHGSPQEFELAVWRAHADLFLTTEEARAAIHEYHEELKMAFRAEEQPRRFE